MDDEPIDPLPAEIVGDDEPADDGLHLRISPRTLRRIGLAALLLVVAAGGLAAGFLIAGDGDGDERATATLARRDGSTTSRAVSTTTIPATRAGATSGNGSGSTEGVDEVADEVAGAVGEEPPAAEAEPPADESAPLAPTAQLSLVPIPLGCGGVGPTLKVTWSTTDAVVVSLRVDGGIVPVGLNGSIVLDVDCGRLVSVRVVAISDNDLIAEAQDTITINP